MKKRNVGFTRNFTKLIGTALALSLMLSTNVHAEELDELNNTEDIQTISEGIDALNGQVDALGEKCSDEGVASEISEISNGISTLDDQIDIFANGYVEFMSSIYRNKADIISSLNRNVYVMDKISDSASYSDIISKINDIKYHGTLNIALNSNDVYTLESGYYDGGTIDVSAIVEAARQEGYNAGKEEGDKAGYQRGLAAGDKAGYQRGLAEGNAAGYNKGRSEGMSYSGGLTIDGWGRADWNTGVTSCRVYPGTYAIRAAFNSFGNYTPHFELYLNGNLIYQWGAQKDEDGNLNAEIVIPYEGILECRASSRNANAGMANLYGAVYKK